jgi:hypothetical protein
MIEDVLPVVPEEWAVEEFEEDVERTVAYYKVKKVLEKKRLEQDQMFITLRKRLCLDEKTLDDDAEIVEMTFSVCSLETESARKRKASMTSRFH